jgi:hypothetical protein
MSNSKRVGRRQFLRYTTTASGLLLAERAFAQIRPCPPIIAVDGPPAGPNGDCSSLAETDWLQRISDPGVVWYHDFRSAAEVNQFRWQDAYGNDPQGGTSSSQHVFHQASDGIGGGGCLQINLPATSRRDNYWWRPFSPLRAGGNGRTTDDPGANGTIARKTWNPPQQGSTYTADWVGGNYAHADYANQEEAKDGTDFYLQVRVKLDPAWLGPITGAWSGKIMYISRVERSLTAQEINPQLHSNNGGHPQPFHMYAQGSPALDGSWPYGGPWPSNDLQPGSQYGTCTIGNPQGSGCWRWSYGEWVTLLIHVIPGHENDDHTTSNNDTGIEVWAAKAGQSTYTKIWDRKNYNFDFTNAWGARNGWNALILANWHNNWSGGTPLWIRYTQVIFSKAFVPCPQA